MDRHNECGTVQAGPCGGGEYHHCLYPRLRRQGRRAAYPTVGAMLTAIPRVDTLRFGSTIAWRRSDTELNRRRAPRRTGRKGLGAGCDCMPPSPVSASMIILVSRQRRELKHMGALPPRPPSASRVDRVPLSGWCIEDRYPLGILLGDDAQIDAIRRIAPTSARRCRGS